VIGGNVSLYNESGGRDIDPTPVVGSLGVVESLVAPPPGWNWHRGDAIVLVGHREAAGPRPFPLAGSRWATRRGRRGGRLGEFDGARLVSTFAFVTSEVAAICAGQTSDVSAVHDVSAGGLATALAAMASVSGLGVSVAKLEGHGELFAEFPGRFVMATSDADAFVARAVSAGVPVTLLGTVGGSRLQLGDLVSVDVAELAARRQGALAAALELA